MDDPKKISEQTQTKLLKQIASWETELRSLLPNLPKDIKIEFNNYFLISFTGTGGFALTKDTVALAFDPNFKGNKTKQMEDFKGSYFHEAYHLVQGFTGEDADSNLSAIENAILEGAATVFEKTRTKTDPPWSHYENKAIMLKWIEEIKSLPIKYDWRKYKFYDEKTERRWIMYKTGTFIVEEALKKNPSLKIEDLAALSAIKILELSEL